MSKTYKKSIVWFRQDLRLADNPALSEAIRLSESIVPIFIFHKSKPALGEASAWWLHHSLSSLEKSLNEIDSYLVIRKGEPEEEIAKFVESENIDSIFWNRLYQPSDIKRDKKIKDRYSKTTVDVKSFNGSLLIEPWNILNSSNKPFQVFTPFWKKLNREYIPPKLLPKPKKVVSPKLKLKSIKVKELNLLPKITWDKEFYNQWTPGETGAKKFLDSFLSKKVDSYQEERDFPRISATSRLSPYLHFGEISPKQIWLKAEKKLETGKSIEPYLRQIAWRDFAHSMLFHFPATTNKPLREKFSKFPTIKSAKSLRAWQEGKTGYPIVDAGMRELWVTGWMHNRVRMIVGSFLVKHLLQSWQKGAEWFWDTLVDADLANNTFGWQWIAGCGADAAPYFRIFNPILQGEKFDKQGDYVKKWIPELSELPKQYLHKPWEAPKAVLLEAGIELGVDYPFPIVDHQEARARALEAYDELK